MVERSPKGMGMGITHVGVHAHGHRMFVQVSPWQSSGHHQGVPSGNPLLHGLLHTSGRSMMLGEGGVGGVTTGELNESHQHMGLGGVCGGHCGMTGSGLKEACSRVET